MPIADDNWVNVSPTEFAHEQEAFDFIKQHASGVARAWSNFEFVESSGKVYEVDLMILTTTQLFLIEVKSWAGILDGTMNNMVRYSKGNRQPTPVTNPILLANKKAKVLASLLQEQPSMRSYRVPFVQAVLFFNNQNLELRIPPDARPHVYFRNELFQGLKSSPGDLQNPRKRLDAPRIEALGKALREIGIRGPSRRTLKVGEWVIKELLADGDLYQDHLANHQSMGETFRRVRTFNVPSRGTEPERAKARRAAQREFKLTDALHHPGILKPYSFVEHELGPALIFPYEQKAERLDHYLASHDAQLGLEQRLSLVRQLADVLRYAHTRRVYHRGLAPQSIMVSFRADAPELQVMDWQTGMEKDVTTGTSHIGELMTKGAKAYMAPEAFHNPTEAAGHLVDIFGWGAVAFHILTGVAPAETQLELYQKLQDHPGLRLSAVTDGLGGKLEALVESCTNPVVLKRPADIGEVLDHLDEATAGAGEIEEEVINPLEAEAGDRLPGGYLVIRRLGKGAMALALEVLRDDVNYVLKVAHNPEHTDHMLREAEALQALDHPYIIKFYEVEEMGGRACLVIQKAGEETLARRLTEQGTPQLDFLDRWGQDLMKALIHLEQKGVRHRDIKPANLGVMSHKKDSAEHLMLFDFSLAGTPDENIDAGTREYIDPFLQNKRPPRWEPSADRYSAAVTLHEMATGTLPRWGDGKTHPGLNPDAQLVLESERFDPAVRERLTAFFSRALARDSSQRFHNAEEMLDAWREAFQAEAPRVEVAQEDPAELERALQHATLSTTLASLGLEVRLLRALEHLNAHTIEAFLDLPGGALHTAAGVGNQTRRRLGELHNRLTARFERERLQAVDEEELEAEDQGLLEAFLVPVLGDEKDPDLALRESYLGLSQSTGSHDWPTLAQVCQEHGLEQRFLAKRLPGWRVKWGKLSSLKFLRNELDQLLRDNGGIVTSGEVALGLLSRHGSFSNDRKRRMQLSHALTRAAVEAEQTTAQPRFQWRRVGSQTVISQTEEQMLYLSRLAEVADRCAQHEPLLSPGRVGEEIRAVARPEGTDALTPHRRLRLAALCSQHAAVSSREELYPRGMAAERALLLAHGALLGQGGLTPKEIEERVLTRYPEAQTLPERPELDAILKRVDPDLIWNEDSEQYQRRLPMLLSSAGSSPHHRFSTTAGSRSHDFNPVAAEASHFEERLQRALKDEDFLVLTVEPNRLAEAEAELMRRFELVRRDLNGLLLQAMRDKVAANPKAKWEAFLKADTGQDGKGWTVLTSRLVPDAMSLMTEPLLQCKQPQLLLNPSLLARYNQLEILENLRDLAGARDGLSSVWLLLPSEDTARAPMIDGKPVPLLHGGQKARIPDAWLANAHRTAREKLAR